MVPSILARLRTMPASFISAAIFFASYLAILFGSKLSNALRKLSLAQDRDPRQAGLEAVEDQLFEQCAVVIFRYAPFIVVIGDIERIVARPGTAHQTVRVQARF